MRVVLTFLLTAGAAALGGCSTLATLNSEPVQTLIAAKEDDEKKLAALDAEEASFQKILKAVQSGDLEPETPRKEILKRYGQPVIRLPQDTGEKWGYKSKKATWFDGPRVFVFLDEAGNLERWSCEEANC